MVVKEFNESSKVLHLRFYKRELSEPKRNAFVAGGFIFASAELFQQIPWDPNIYFYGEEITFALRAWSHGWDIYTPHICLIYHYYSRQEAVKHSSDHKQWHELAQKSNKRVWHLVGTELSSDVDIEPQFQLGVERDLKSYQVFSGVNFETLNINTKASNGDVVMVKK